MPNGDFMIANLGPDGGVFRLSRDGNLKLELDAVDGRKLPSTNFVNRDAQGLYGLVFRRGTIPGIGRLGAVFAMASSS